MPCYDITAIAIHQLRKIPDDARSEKTGGSPGELTAIREVSSTYLHAVKLMFIDWSCQGLQERLQLA
jgi:hypothetical protein